MQNRKGSFEPFSLILSRLAFCSFLLVLFSMMFGCSTSRNTREVRLYHAFAAKYNVGFNAQKAYDEGIRVQLAGSKEDYARPLPVFVSQCSGNQQLASGLMYKAVLKSEKAIREHSIVAKPKYKAVSRPTEAYKQWLKRKEFNPYLHRAWMLRGKALFGGGQYEEAVRTFRYIIRLYRGQQEIVSEAYARLAACYVAQRRFFDAEEAIRHISPTNRALRHLQQQVIASLLVEENRWNEALPVLEQLIKSERVESQKARLYYLQGQVLQQLLREPEARTSFGRCAEYASSELLIKHARLQAKGCDTLIVPEKKAEQREEPECLMKDYWLSYLNVVPEKEEGMGTLAEEVETHFATSKFSLERETDFYFVFILPEQLVTKHKLKFSLAQFNFSSFQLKTFDLRESRVGRLDLISVSTFSDFKECLHYQQLIRSNEKLMTQWSGVQTLVISALNFRNLLSVEDVDAYRKFYEENFVKEALPNVEGLNLDEELMLREEEMEEDDAEEDISEEKKQEEEDDQEMKVIFEDE